MFLTKGELFHEASWAIWFQHAAGLYPLDRLLPATCSGDLHAPVYTRSSQGYLHGLERTGCSVDAFAWVYCNLEHALHAREL